MSSVSSLNPLYSLSGLLVGILVGQTGVGGGSLMTPLLILLFGIHPATAVGTDLLFAAVTKTVGTLVHGFNKTVSWTLTGRLALGSIPATALTLFVVSKLALRGEYAAMLISSVLGFALVFTAAVAHAAQADPRSGGEPDRPPHPGAGPEPDHPDRRRHGRAGLAVLGRRRSGRRHGDGLPLSAHAARPHRRLGHRPCRAADALRRRRPLGARVAWTGRCSGRCCSARSPAS